MIDGCKHWWLISEPKTTESVGECKFCKKTKTFPNSFYELHHGFNPSGAKCSWILPASKEFSEFSPDY